MLKGINGLNAPVLYAKCLLIAFLFIYCLWIFCFRQEKVKAVFDNLIQLEHLNIVKFHKYWADVKENRARVGGCFLCELMSPFVPLSTVALFGFCWHFLFPAAGHFHHWVHVFRKSQTILKEDEEKPQDHEWEGARAQTKLTNTLEMNNVSISWLPNFRVVSNRLGNAGALKYCRLSGDWVWTRFKAQKRL